MALKLEAEEPLLNGLHRILKEQLEEGVKQMRRASRSADSEAIHEARKCFKKARALLRLLRGEIGEARFARENGELRGIAAGWGEVRDEQVRLEALRDLRKEFGGRVAGSWLVERDTRLRLRKAKAAFGSRLGRLRNEEAMAALTELSKRIQGLRLVGNDWQCVGRALEKAYCQARREMRHACETGKAADLHEWRKKVKLLYYAFRVLEPIWPEYLGLTCHQLGKLEEDLGRIHDLAILAKSLPSAEGGSELRARIREARRKLERKAFSSGFPLFEEKPEVWAAQLERCWKQWSGESGSSAA